MLTGDIIPGVCYPVFYYLLFSFISLFLVMINSDNKDAIMMGFFIFMIIVILAALIASLCNLGLFFFSWMVCLLSLLFTGYLVNNNYIGKIDLLKWIGDLIIYITNLLKTMYVLIKSLF